MAFPRIDKPCPYKANLAAVMDGDFCTMCSRSVIDLNAMGTTDRKLFLSSCDGEVCVSYSLKPAIAAAALAVAAMALPGAAAAQAVDPAPVAAQQVAQPDPAAIAVDDEDMLIVVGGIRDPKNAKLVDNPLDDLLPPLPIVVEDDPAPAVPVPPATSRK